MAPTLSPSPVTFSGPVREAGRSEERAYGTSRASVSGQTENWGLVRESMGSTNSATSDLVIHPST